MIDAQFFTLDDIQTVRKVSVNIDDFNQYAQEVQRNYVQRLLGTELYLALIDDLVLGIPQTQRFVDLVDGVRYSVGSEEFVLRGVKLYASYLWLYIYMMDSEVQITPIGTQMFRDEAAEKTSKQQAQAHFIRSAEGLEDGIIHYLDNNHPTYPEVRYSEEPAEKDNFSFKVVGRRYTAPDEFTDVGLNPRRYYPYNRPYRNYD